LLEVFKGLTTKFEYNIIGLGVIKEAVMKFIHTSDWHIGKSIHEVNLLEDQKAVLKKFLNIIDEEKPDAIIIAGDLYDRGIPNKEAVNLLDDVLHEIVTIKQIPILCIAGNHDSGDRLEFASRILKRNGLHIEGKFKKDVQKIELQDSHGKVNFYLIPFAYISEAGCILEDESIKSFDDTYNIILKKIEEEMNLEERNVIVTHGYIVTDSEALEVNDSVRPLAVGTSEYVNVEYFKNFDYTALGHLHKPQKVEWEHVRYSGSLLKYSFSETNHNKGIVVVEMEEKGNITIRNISLTQDPELRKIEGLLNDLISADPNGEGLATDYFMAILTDENPICDAIGQLRAVYPNILRMEYKNRIMTEHQGSVVSLKIKEKKSETTLFQEFYQDMTGKELTKEKAKIVENVFQEMLIKDGELL